MPADFRARQKALTDWLRDPASVPAPAGMERRRLDVYRELFFNNVAGFVENAYPVLQALTEATEWQRLVAGFFAKHRCHTPYFREIAREFLAFAEDHHIEVTTPAYPLDRAAAALADLACGEISGAAVLHVRP